MKFQSFCILSKCVRYIKPVGFNLILSPQLYFEMPNALLHKIKFSVPQLFSKLQPLRQLLQSVIQNLGIFSKLKTYPNLSAYPKSSRIHQYLVKTKHKIGADILILSTLPFIVQVKTNQYFMCLISSVLYFLYVYFTQISARQIFIACFLISSVNRNICSLKIILIDMVIFAFFICSLRTTFRS